MGLDITPYQALWFLPFVTPICIWAAWSDLKYMKIRNMSVLAMVAVFLVVGLIALPFEDYLWRLVHIAVVLVIGFLMNMARVMGAGDAKFAAAMAPFIALPDAGAFLLLLSVVMIAALATHRMFRAMPGFRARTADWESWRVSKFPMGFALGSALVFYLLMGTIPG
ncbi:A24 family peptidase [Anianabacter salinae]|uniref:A24 family peptidase n=1 Tax=Anianabacter salinae TaxID=2851023 RepID=UPI00225E0DAB|nr:prepilin peptidase [Anianabacter salinae]MBV0911279.1 prepilin peptidase [Anianabacter salinae]